MELRGRLSYVAQRRMRPGSVTALEAGRSLVALWAFLEAATVVSDS